MLILLSFFPKNSIFFLIFALAKYTSLEAHDQFSTFRFDNSTGLKNKTAVCDWCFSCGPAAEHGSTIVKSHWAFHCCVHQLPLQQQTSAFSLAISYCNGGNIFQGGNPIHGGEAHYNSQGPPGDPCWPIILEVEAYSTAHCAISPWK